MEVPMLDLKKQFAAIRSEMMSAIENVMDRQDFINGPEVEQLERRIAQYCECEAAVAVSSGTDALLGSLMALGIAAGDEVITTPYTFFATAGSIWRTGARPVFVDIEPDTFNIDPSRIAAALTERTRAIMPVHLFGQSADMEPILAVAGQHGLHVIEDAAQAIGATYRGMKAGAMGTVGCFSFYPTKNLGGLGDGGIVTTQDPALAQRLASLRAHGQASRYHHEWVGANFRLDTLQAAGLLVKLPRLDDWSAARRANAALYDGLFDGFEAVVTPKVREGNVSVFNHYVIRVPRRDELQAFLKQHGVGTIIYYPLSLHEQECFRSLGYQRGDFPESERAAAESLALPVYPELAREQIEYVAARVREFLA